MSRCSGAGAEAPRRPGCREKKGKARCVPREGGLELLALGGVCCLVVCSQGWVAAWVGAGAAGEGLTRSRLG
eukprot:365693-Chlamydomonas_euryale.AAC.32